MKNARPITLYTSWLKVAFKPFGFMILATSCKASRTISVTQLEFDADRFAFGVISLKTHPADFWLGLGAVTMLILLDIIETVEGFGETASHPSGKRRIEAALEFLRCANPPLARAASDYLHSVAAACETTLRQNSGVAVAYG